MIAARRLQLIEAFLGVNELLLQIVPLYCHSMAYALSAVFTGGPLRFVAGYICFQR